MITRNQENMNEWKICCPLSFQLVPKTCFNQCKVFLSLFLIYLSSNAFIPFLHTINISLLRYILCVYTLNLYYFYIITYFTSKKNIKENKKKKKKNHIFNFMACIVCVFYDNFCCPDQFQCCDTLQSQQATCCE